MTIVLGSGEGKELNVIGLQFSTKAAGADTANAFAVSEVLLTAEPPRALQQPRFDNSRHTRVPRHEDAAVAGASAAAPGAVRAQSRRAIIQAHPRAVKEAGVTTSRSTLLIGVMLSALLFGLASSSDSDSDSGSPTTAPQATSEATAAPESTQAAAAAFSLADTSVRALLSTHYKFPPGGPAPLDELPFPPGSVEARWYKSGDRYVVYYHNLSLDGPAYCPGNSIRKATGFEHISNSPAVAGACAGASTLATEDGAGVVLCGDLVLYVTQIPSDAEGDLFGTIEILETEGAGTGLTSIAPTSMGEAPEVDLSSCSDPIR